MEDSRIIELYWNRNEDAIEETDRQYGGMLTRMAEAILHDRQDSEECVSDTYLQAWNNIPPTRPVKLLAYLGRITRNLALKRYRHNHAQKRGAPLLLQELSECIPTTHSVEQACDSRWLTAVIDGWLQTLSPEDRVLFVRRYWFGESLDTLANDRATTPNKLAGKLFRLRQKLRTALEKEDCL